MKFLIITHVEHVLNEGKYYGYAPYINEMNIWLSHVEDVEVIAPLKQGEISAIETFYQHSNLKFSAIPSIEFTSSKLIFKSFFKLPIILFKIIKACRRADHIHLRCPGNIGLLGVLVQMFFPNKIKTAKYAGNWDPKSQQPVSYRIQKWILKNTFLSKNISALVYGRWPNQTKNVLPFFTASFYDSEINKVLKKEKINTYRFVFIGSLVEGKQPLKAIKIIESLKHKGYDVVLNIYGDGSLKQPLECYVGDNDLQHIVYFHGNVDKETIKTAYNNADFCILLSKSEGWPKAIAEAMFFGVIPIATKVSCVPWMLNNGKRGILVDDNVEVATVKVIDFIENEDFKTVIREAKTWSQRYTLDYFDKEIQNLLYKK
ncbi:glycosyltransferase [Corallibacter sp.]|uniref:glycosyltransferase n=1 Tax=Corallibacter sp. TaxID=2038084 RepID=UPI003AB535DB